MAAGNRHSAIQQYDSEQESEPKIEASADVQTFWMQQKVYEWSVNTFCILVFYSQSMCDATTANIVK